MDKIRNTIIWFLILILYLFLNIFFSYSINNMHIENTTLKSLVTLFYEGIIILTFIIIYYKDFKNDLKEIKKHDKEYIGSSIRIWLIGLIIMIISNSIISLIVGDIASNESLNRSIFYSNYLYAIPSMIILAPIAEETIFRLSLGKIFNNKYIFMIVSGLVFGYIHVIGSTGLEYLYIIPYGALGAAFAYAYKKYNNIYCSVTTHILHNLVCVIILTLL